MRKKVYGMGAGGAVVCIGEASGSGMFTIYGLGMGVWGYTLSALTALNLAANHKLESVAATARERHYIVHDGY